MALSVNPSQIIFRTVSEIDGPAVIDLRRRVDDLPVPEKISTDFWWWENHQNPYGSSAAVVAVSDKKFVSHMSALPRQVIIKARPYPCSHLVEAMTDRALRKSMVFLHVGYKLERLLKEQKKAFFYCFPNRNSRLIFQRGFQWTDMGSPRVWLYPLRPGRVLHSRPGTVASLLALFAPPVGTLYRKVFRFKPSDRVLHADRFDGRFQPLLDEIHSRPCIILERTLDYLNWRYCKAVARSYLGISNYDDPFYDNGYLCKIAWENGEFDRAMAHNRACLLKERDILIKRGFRKPDELKFIKQQY